LLLPAGAGTTIVARTALADAVLADPVITLAISGAGAARAAGALPFAAGGQQRHHQQHDQARATQERQRAGLEVMLRMYLASPETATSLPHASSVRRAPTWLSRPICNTCRTRGDGARLVTILTVAKRHLECLGTAGVQVRPGAACRAKPPSSVSDDDAGAVQGQLAVKLEAQTGTPR
jgi:hypothetical protein